MPTTRLEAVAERQVTVNNRRHVLADTFFVIDTQNPVEHHGTYPLPEAQLDRFALKLAVGYPDPGNELDMLAAAVGDPTDRTPLPPALDGAALRDLQARVARVAVAPVVRGYLVDLAAATRAHLRVALGLSPRGLLTWQSVARAWAFLNGCPFVTPDDVQDVARPVLGVRLGLNPDAGPALIDDLLTSTPVPA
ncbi:MoxR family ATPase [bacterium]|nr:MoxR family ATPase [bacterium]